MIVDDGSTDKTADIVKPFIDGENIHVRYIKQENGGQHRAINHGVREAKGELFLILDSYDSIHDDSLALINENYSQIKGNYRFGGVVGYMAHHDGAVLGHGNERIKLTKS